VEDHKLVIKDMQRKIAKLTHQLMKIRSVEDHSKSNHKIMANFENLFQRQEKGDSLLIMMSSIIRVLYKKLL